MNKETKYRIKDVVYNGKYLLLVEGKEIQELKFQNLQWEIMVDNQVKTILIGLKIPSLYQNLELQDTVLETDLNLSFLSNMKNKKVPIFLKRKTEEILPSDKDKVSKEAKKEEQRLYFFLDEK